jgi:hypothetical protein
MKAVLSDVGVDGVGVAVGDVVIEILKRRLTRERLKRRGVGVARREGITEGRPSWVGRVLIVFVLIFAGWRRPLVVVVMIRQTLNG